MTFHCRKNEPKKGKTSFGRNFKEVNFHLGLFFCGVLSRVKVYTCTNLCNNCCCSKVRLITICCKISVSGGLKGGRLWKYSTREGAKFLVIKFKVLFVSLRSEYNGVLTRLHIAVKQPQSLLLSHPFSSIHHLSQKKDWMHSANPCLASYSVTLG